MRITWNNLHYVVITVIILNFVMLYFLKNTIEEVNDIPVIPKETQITTLTTKANTTEPKEISIAEDIGKVFSDSGSPLPLIDVSKVKTFLSDIHGTEELLVLPHPNQQHELVPPQNKGIALLLLVILIASALCVTYFQIKYMNTKKQAKVYGNVDSINQSNTINNYYILHDE